MTRVLEVMLCARFQPGKMRKKRQKKTEKRQKNEARPGEQRCSGQKVDRRRREKMESKWTESRSKDERKWTASGQKAGSKRTDPGSLKAMCPSGPLKNTQFDAQFEREVTSYLSEWVAGITGWITCDLSANHGIALCVSSDFL